MENTRANSPTLPHQDKKAAMDAVLASETFARSEQLRAFLAYVCEMEMAGRSADVTEYLIGVKALGRNKDYSPLEDSSVRTRAYELRHRLQKYYTTENPDAVIRIELPKGAYTPRFLTGHPEPKPAPAPLPPKPRNPILYFLAGVALTALAVWFVILRLQTDGIEPALRRAWTPLINKDHEVLISIGSPLHLLVTPYLGKPPENSPHYPAPDELYALFARYRNLPKYAKLEMQPVQKSIPMGNVESVIKILSTLQSLHGQFRILPETSSPLTALRRRSAILFGSPWYSRSAAVLLEKTPWTTRWDEATQQIGIFGQGTREGKSYLPKRGPRGEYQEVFGLLSVLPNDTSAGGPKSIVVFSGLTSAGTHGAATFFTSGPELKKLEDQLHTWPKSYQVVVRCHVSEDAQLLSYTYETHDILLP